MNTSYFVFMLGSALIAAGVHYLLAGGLKKRGLLAALTFMFGAVLGAVCARLTYCLICIQDVLLDGIEETLLSDSMECMSFFGGVVGVIFGAVLAAKCTGNKPMAALNAYAPAGALMAAMARFAEYFLGTICVGRMIEDEAFQFFPLAQGVDYGYDYTEWYLAVFMLAGIAYFIVFLVSLNKFKDRRFLRTLFYICLPQIILESLRNYNRLTWTQFVRVEQLACMLYIEAIFLLYAVWAGKGTKNRFLPAIVGLVCAGVFIGVEFALDKTNLPHVLTYAVMVAGLVVLGFMEHLGFKKLTGKNVS
ncbi:MAG: prolipoprotein diacylglyceryl transferase [Clostridia bacterium]|nr:prolipoprotein diacylglyceryl transferase [Clostridia bacterium]